MSQPPSKISPTRLILIVEDSLMDRELITRILVSDTHEVVACPTLLIALEFLKNRTPDLLLLDENLPDGTSSSRLEDIRKLAPATPLIFVSGQADLDTTLALSHHRVAAIFHKPLPTRALLNKIRELLDGFATSSQTEATTTVTGRHETTQADDLPPTDTLLCKHFPGVSAVHGILRDRIAKNAGFAHTLLLLGREGCVFWPVVRDLHAHGPFASSPLLPFGPRCFCAAEVAARIAQHVATEQSITLALERVDSYRPDQAAVLSDLIDGLGEFSAYAGRLRFVMSATHDLLENPEKIQLPPALTERIAGKLLYLPDLDALRADRAHLARRIIQETGASANILSDAAIQWLENKRWPGDYDQFRRVILIAIAATANEPLTVELLDSSLAIELTVPADAYELTLAGVTEGARIAYSPPPSAHENNHPPVPTAPPPPASAIDAPPTAAPSATPSPALPARRPQRAGSYDFSSRLRSSLNTSDESPPPFTAPVHPRFAPKP